MKFNIREEALVIDIEDLAWLSKWDIQGCP